MRNMTFMLVCVFLVGSIIIVGGNEDNGDICGTKTGWAKKYIERHNLMIAGQITPKYIISIPVMAGLADVLLGYVSAFAWALLTDRTFLILPVNDLDQHCNSRSIETAYNPRFVNWTSFPLEYNDYKCLLPPYVGDCSTINKNEYMAVPTGLTTLSLRNYTFEQFFQVNGGFREAFRTEDMTRYPPSKFDASVFLFLSNRGVTVRLFDNPHHGNSLRQMGLTPATAFPCFFDFLFRMKPSVCSGSCISTEHTLHHLGKKESNTLRIGIHVRDEHGHDAPEHFYCADSVIAAAKNRGQNVSILLVTASVALQETALRRYGSLLMLPLGKPEAIVAVHDRPDLQPKDVNEGCATRARDDAKAMLDSVRDMHLLSLTDVHIISHQSGFGVVSSMLKPKSQPPVIYLMELKDPKVLRDCAKEPAGDPLTLFADNWSGL